MNLVSIGRGNGLPNPKPKDVNGRILLVKPPYFSPWTPPLGIAILKSFLEPHGYSVRCYDFNADPDLWGMHHKYFNVLQTLEDVSINDGYSKLWWILDAHMLAYANGADPAACAKVLSAVVPLQGMRISQSVIRELLPLVEGFYKRLDELIDDFNLAEYAAVGTSTYTTSLGPSLFFLKRVKGRHPHVKTIMGGGAFADDLALGSDNLDTLVREYEFVDHFVLGEGELLLLKLLQGELAHKRLISLADLSGKTLPMQDVPIPDFSDVGTENYYHLTIEGARSCPFQCSFCSETIQWGDYRKRPMHLFADQVIELARRYSKNSFFMGDSLMNPYLNQFAGQLLERKANILYDGYLRADKPVSNRSFVKTWADSGCYRVRLGIESAAARVLNSMDKMTTPAVISDVLKTLANAGIRTTTYWITGFPGETEEDFQETCEFIREHHRYIYELEAHAYYYYPYGQIGSRLHQCHSIYPDDVTDIIKFRVWEINDANPPRVERFDRLRRISALASKLGLPNIYTMAERFAAEERWHKLYPLALEVYSGTRLHREPPRLPEKPIQVFDPLRCRGDASGGDYVLCYQVSVAGPIDQDVLKAAAAEVGRNNDVLQLSLKDELQLVSREATNNPSDFTAFVDESEDQPQAIERYARALRPEANRSFRIVVVRGEESSELFFLGHGAIVDGRALTLLCEDLFRVYRQLGNRRQVSLCPVKKTYTQLIQALAQTREETLKVEDFDASTIFGGPDAQILSLGKQVWRRLSSETLTECDLTPVAVVSAALLKVLSEVTEVAEQAIEVTADYRSQDPDLDRTVGVLTRVQAAVAAPLEKRMLLNLEFFVAEPWLGGDQWTPRGFLNPPSRLQSGYVLEVMPVLSHEGMAVNFSYRQSAGMDQIVEEVKRRIPAELNLALDECDRYAAAKTFWLHEYEKGGPVANLDLRDESSDNDAGWSVLPAWIESPVLDQLQLKLDLDVKSALLSALSIILTRLNGRDEAVVLTCVDGNMQPVKLNARWDLSFASFSRHVSDKFSRSLGHGSSALAILENHSKPPKALPVFDVACVVNDLHASQQNVVDMLKTQVFPLAQTLSLVLEISPNDHRFQLHCKRDKLAESLVQKIALYLPMVLAEAANDAGVRLGEMKLTEDVESSFAPDILAQDVFSFGAVQ